MSVDENEVSERKRITPAVPVIFLIGCGFFLSAYMTGDAGQYFWGAIICTGAILLYMVKQKDWKKHFEELEKEREARARSSRDRKEHKDE